MSIIDKLVTSTEEVMRHESFARAGEAITFDQ